MIYLKNSSTTQCYEAQARNEMHFNDWSSDVRETQVEKFLTNFERQTNKEENKYSNFKVM